MFIYIHLSRYPCETPQILETPGYTRDRYTVEFDIHPYIHIFMYLYILIFMYLYILIPIHTYIHILI